MKIYSPCIYVVEMFYFLKLWVFYEFLRGEGGGSSVVAISLKLNLCLSLIITNNSAKMRKVKKYHYHFFHLYKDLNDWNMCYTIKTNTIIIQIKKCIYNDNSFISHLSKWMLLRLLSKSSPLLRVNQTLNSIAFEHLYTWLLKIKTLNTWVIDIDICFP